MAPQTLIIGCKFRGHDSSVFVILPEEKRLCAIETERVTRYKHDRTFPLAALNRVLADQGIRTGEVERVVFCHAFSDISTVTLQSDFYPTDTALRRHFGTPFKKDYDEALTAFKKRSPLGKLLRLLTSVQGWLLLGRKLIWIMAGRPKASVDAIVSKELTRRFPKAQIDIRSYDHGYCHAVSSYVTCPFSRATLWSFDAWGDKQFSAVYVADGQTCTRRATSPRVYDGLIDLGSTESRKTIQPSIGGIYTYFTEMLGFTPWADEGKVEALAAYGKPVPSLLAELLSLVSIEDLAMAVDRVRSAEILNVVRFEQLKKDHSREDLSATVQRFLEEVTLNYLPKVLEATGIRQLALSGGVAANVVNNLLIYEHITPDLHITPAMGDDGAAQGAAYAYLLEAGQDIGWLRAREMPYYSTSYDRDAIRRTLDHHPELTVEDVQQDWPERVAQMIADGVIGAIYQGRMEWGPRALGNRSIVADPRRKDFREIINREIKRRPSFQPFCPSILAEEKDRLFEKAYLNKHMTCAFRLKKEFWDQLPSAIHIDGTARAQFVEQNDNPTYYRVLKRVKELTGFGVIINTSFNKHGRTIVESPEDAIRDFLDTDMGYVVMEGFIVKRKQAQ